MRRLSLVSSALLAGEQRTRQAQLSVRWLEKDKLQGKSALCCFRQLATKVSRLLHVVHPELLLVSEAFPFTGITGYLALKIRLIASVYRHNQSANFVISLKVRLIYYRERDIVRTCNENHMIYTHASAALRSFCSAFHNYRGVTKS
jgi:hypothetical protein